MGGVNLDRRKGVRGSLEKEVYEPLERKQATQPIGYLRMPLLTSRAESVGVSTLSMPSFRLRKRVERESFALCTGYPSWVRVMVGSKDLKLGRESN